MSLSRSRTSLVR